MYNDLHTAVIQGIPMAYSYKKAILDEKGEIIDFEFIEVNQFFADQIRKPLKDLPGKRITDLFEGITPKDYAWIVSLATRMKPGQRTQLLRKLSYLGQWFKIYVYCPGKYHLSFVYFDLGFQYEARSLVRNFKNQHRVIHQLSSSRHFIEGNIYDFIMMLTPLMCRLFKVWRAGVWFFDDNGEKLRCFDNYDSETGEHSSGMLLAGFKYNTEFYHLKHSRYVDAYDALNDERVAAYHDDYLIPLGITSLLDVGITIEGQTRGVLCLEQKGPLRKWGQQEINFACQLSEHVAIVLGVFEKKVTKNQLLKSQAKLKSIFFTAPSGMGLVLSRVIQEVNDKLCHMTGYSREELLGKSARMLYLSDEEYDLVGKEKYRQIDELGIGSVETKWKTRDGRILDVLLYSAPMSPNDLTQGITFTATDITRRKETEEKLRKSEKRYQSIVQCQYGLICRFLPDTTLTFVNNAFCRYFEKSENELLGNKLSEVLPFLSHELWMEKLAFCSSGKPMHIFENQISDDDENSIWQEWNIQAIFDEKETTAEYQAIGSDITDRKLKLQLEQDLEIATRSSEFKKNFLANISHEMRTPLTGVIGMAEILAHTRLDHQQQEYVNILRDSGEDLMEIINQVLDFSRIEHGSIKLNYCVFSPEDLAIAAGNLFRLNCDKNIEFFWTLDEKLPAFIEADQVRVEQIINNLLSNAIKFTADGNVKLEITQAKKLPGRKVLIKVTVSDTGIGIAREKQTEIFEPFFQLDSLDTRAFEGTGLGLTVCKNLAAMHGGEIGLESEPGKGSRFWFTFVAGISQQMPSDNELNRKPAYELKPLTILFAEDKQVSRKVVGLMLSSMGHKVVVAENGEEALRLFSKGKYDLILMDIQMPVMDGVKAVQKLRELYKNLPPVVGLSANAFEGDKEKYLAAGMDAYLTKPVKKKDFEELLKKLFPH